MTKTGRIFGPSVGWIEYRDVLCKVLACGDAVKVIYYRNDVHVFGTAIQMNERTRRSGTVGVKELAGLCTTSGVIKPWSSSAGVVGEGET